MKLLETKKFKGNEIYIIEDALGQTFNVVIGCFSLIFHTTADAKRYINKKYGKEEPYTYEPLTPSAMGSFNEVMGFARKKALQALQADETPAEPTITPEQEFESKRDALKGKLEAKITEAKERVEEFVADSLKRFGDFRVWGYSPENFNIALFKDEKPVFGANWAVYVTKQYHSRGEKGYEVVCNIGTAGSFPVGQGNEREMLYMAFARFLNDLNDWGLRKYLIRVQEQADEIWHSFYDLCRQYNKNRHETELFED